MPRNFLKRFEKLLMKVHIYPSRFLKWMTHDCTGRGCQTKVTSVKEEKLMPGYKAAKDRLTLLFGGNASGDMKLKPLLVYHSENPRALKNIPNCSLPVVWKSNPKAWVTQAIFQDWFFHQFILEVEKYCLEKDVPFNILLLLDGVPGHPPIHGQLSFQRQSSASAT